MRILHYILGFLVMTIFMHMFIPILFTLSSPIAAWGVSGLFALFAIVITISNTDTR